MMRSHFPLIATFGALILGLVPSMADAQCVGGAPNAIKQNTEGCDDGNGQSGDGCGPTCLVESGYACQALSLSLLVTENYPGSGAVWNIDPSGAFGTQTVNTSTPTIGLFDADAMAATYTIDIRVNETNDDDFIGFVLGFSPGEASSASADYLLVDWKQANQNSNGANGQRGLAISRVTGIPNPVTNSFWGHTGAVAEFARASTLGNTGWADNTTYRFVITYTATSLVISVNGIQQFSLTGTFPAGEIGFYGLSQPQVRYELIGPRISFCETVCGSGTIHGTEQCDDGGTTSGNGCSATCTIESGYVCNGQPSSCMTVCGDGVRAGAETCDDDNVADGDGCSATCTQEIGWDCTGVTPDTCVTDCGDGITAGTETCDDDGTTSGDGCSAQCRDEVVIATPVDGSTSNDANVTVVGTTDPGATVVIRVDGVVVGMTTADPGGAYIFPLPILLDGTRVILATSTDALGHVSTDAVSVTIDAGVGLDITGPANGTVTSDTTPTVTGVTLPNVTVSVSVSGIGSIGTPTADANGIFSIDMSVLPDGMYTITATYTDAGGTTVTDTTTITINTTAPALDITGPVGSTSDTTPTITGTTEPGLVVTVVVDGTTLGTATADGSGNWTFAVTTPLADGPHTIGAQVTRGGLTSNDTAMFAVDTDTSVSITSPTDGALIVITTPTITGVAEAFASVELFVDGASIGTVIAGADGSYSLTVPTALIEGAHMVRAVATDGAGNVDEAESDFIVGTGGTDQDGDGVPDTTECPSGTPCDDTNEDGTPDYLDVDDDGDGIPTVTERVDGDDTDSDEDGTPDYLDVDDDNDGVPTREELTAGLATIDTDGDGTPNHLDADDDGDGIPTNDERPSDTDRDTDSDGTPDYLDVDDDNDGILTSTERADGMPHGNDVDDDGQPNWLDTNSDGDDAPDESEGREDSDGDGIPNYLDPSGLVPSSAGGVAGGAMCALGTTSTTSAWLGLMIAALGLGYRRRKTR